MKFSDLISYIISVAITFYPTWRILKRTGFNPTIALLILIPVLGPLVIVLILAFRDWPVLKNRTER